MLVLLVMWSAIGMVAGYAQWHIEGKVVDEDKGEPIAGVTIFINNTTYGTSSGNNGNFELRGIPMGTYEVVVSSMGYQTHVTQIELRSTSAVYLSVKLRAKAELLEEVEIVAFERKGWNRWGRLFLETFIGTSPNAPKVKLLNPEVLRFRHYPQEGYLEAVATEPLVIENRSLGYTVVYLLEDFRVDFHNGINQYAGYPHFKELEGSRRRQKIYAKRREASYARSLMRFMRSLYHGTISEDGFEVKRMQRIPNLEKQRIMALQQTHTRLSDTYTEDSLAYFRKILNEEDLIDSIFPLVLTSDSLLVDSVDGRKKLIFEDFLRVQNIHLKEEPGYLRSLREVRRPGLQTSILSLYRVPYIWIERNGTYFPAQGLYMKWYWNWYDRLADLLPIDYDPEINNR